MQYHYLYLPDGNADEFDDINNQFRLRGAAVEVANGMNGARLWRIPIDEMSKLIELPFEPGRRIIGDLDEGYFKISSRPYWPEDLIPNDGIWTKL